MNEIAATHLTKTLFNLYYRTDAGEGGLSSHWLQFSRHFDVKLDENGAIESLRGEGFGDLMVVNPISKAFVALGNAVHFFRLPRKVGFLKLLPAALRVTRRMGAYFSFDCLKQVYALDLILQHRSRIKSDPVNVVIIGDGYGFLSALVREVVPNARLLLIDIGKTLLFQAHYLGLVHPRASHALVGSAEAANADFVYCPADRVDAVEGRFDLAINIASMQEMSEETVASYFSFLRRRLTRKNLFYCCNRERKTLPGGEDLRFFAYPWSDRDGHIVEERCPWYGFFISARTGASGPRFLGLRIPFINYFDGPFFHRLTVIETAAAGR